MSNLDWVALPVALIAYFFEFGMAGRWTDAVYARKYVSWRERLGSWFIPVIWFWTPMLFFLQALAASAIFLYWRNSFPVDARVHRDAILGLTIANVFFLKMWTHLLLWGPGYWWAAAVDSFFVFATGTAVVILMGIENAWLPFGLYLLYPIVAFFAMVVTLIFYWNATDLYGTVRRGLKRFPGINGEYRADAVDSRFRGPVRQPVRTGWH